MFLGALAIQLLATSARLRPTPGTARMPAKSALASSTFA